MKNIFFRQLIRGAFRRGDLPQGTIFSYKRVTQAGLPAFQNTNENVSIADRYVEQMFTTAVTNILSYNIAKKKVLNNFYIPLNWVLKISFRVFQNFFRIEISV